MKKIDFFSNLRKSPIYLTLVFSLALGVVGGNSPVSAALPDPTFTVPVSPVIVNEQTPVQVFPGLTFVDSATNYSGGWIEYAVDSSTTGDSVFLETSTVASTTLDSITVVGNTVFKGSGATADAIGVIDGTKNGQNGNNLKISFSNTFTNGTFTDNTANTVGDVVSLSGWTAYKSRVKLSGVSTVAGFPTPADGAFPATTDSTLNKDGSVARNTFTVNPSYTGRSGGGYSVQLATSGQCDNGFCIIRGPYIVSNSSVYLQAGDSVSFYWSALGASDAYDVYGYLLNTSTGATIELLNSTGANGGATQPWTQVTQNISAGQAGSYKFVFIAGTWDASGGRAEGASLLLDDVSVTASASTTIDANDLKNLSLLLRYSNNADAPAATRTLRITTNNGAVDGVQVINVNPVNDPLALQDPGSITRLRNMSDSSTAIGTFVAYDPDTVPVTSIPSTFSISGGTVDSGAGTDTLIGSYGTLVVTSATGAYSYSFFADTITALPVDSYETFTVSAFNGVETATGNLVIKLLAALPSGGSLTARTLSFTSPSPLTFSKIYGERFTVTATPSAGAGDGTITYSAGASTGCSVTGNTVLITSGTGTCTITASISAGSTYNTANTTASIVVTVGKSQLTINGANQEMVYGQNEPNLGAYSLVGSLIGSDAISVTGTRQASIITGVTPVALSVVFTSGSAGNYDLTINSGALIVNPARLAPPTFGTPVRELGGFKVTLTNYDPSLSNVIKVSAGTATLVGPTNGVYSIVVTGITGEVTLEITTNKTGFSTEKATLKSGPLYPQVISMDLSPFDKTAIEISLNLKPQTKITPEGMGVIYSSLTTSVCVIKFDVTVYTLTKGTCTVKATANTAENIFPGASATASFQVLATAVATPVKAPPAKDSTVSTPKTPIADDNKVVIGFTFRKSIIRESEATKIRELLAANKNNVKVVGYAQKNNSQPDLAISLDRAIEVKKEILRLNPKAKVSVMGFGNKPQPLCKAYNNKCALIFFEA